VEQAWCGGFSEGLRSTGSIERAPVSGRCEPRHRRVKASQIARWSALVVGWPVSTLKADILSIIYDCYSQNNNVKMATVNVITGDDFFCSLLL